MVKLNTTTDELVKVIEGMVLWALRAPLAEIRDHDESIHVNPCQNLIKDTCRIGIPALVDKWLMELPKWTGGIPFEYRLNGGDFKLLFSLRAVNPRDTSDNAEYALWLTLWGYEQKYATTRERIMDIINNSPFKRPFNI